MCLDLTQKAGGRLPGAGGGGGGEDSPLLVRVWQLGAAGDDAEDAGVLAVAAVVGAQRLQVTAVQHAALLARAVHLVQQDGQARRPSPVASVHHRPASVAVTVKAYVTASLTVTGSC